MNGARHAAMAVLCVLAAGGLAVASAQAAAKPKTCKKGTARVKTGKTTRCVKLRVAPPAPQAKADSGKQALDLVLGAKWPALKDRRGRTVRSPAQELVRVKGAKAKVAAAVAKGLKLAAAKRPVARAQSGGGGVTGVAEGTTIGFDGDIPAGAFRISVQFRTNDLGGIEGPRCPTAAGLLRGEAKVTTSIAIRMTEGQRVVFDTRTELTDVARYEAHVGDDAKMDTLDVDHTGTVTASTAGDGHTSMRIQLRAHRTAQVNMRTGTYTSSARQFEVRAQIEGAPPGLAAALEAQLASRMTAGTDAAFSRIVGRGMGGYGLIESEINQDGRCVHMVFEPPFDPAKRYKKNESGTFSAYMEPVVERGGRAPGRWSLAAKNLVSVSPESAAGTTPSFTHTVVDDSSTNGYVTFRATSKAGVATRARDVPIDIGSPRYRVTAFTYTDQLSLTGVAPYLGCAPSSSQGNAITFAPSGREEDGALSPPIPAPFGNGEQTGLLSATGRIQKTVAYTGCKWNDDASARVPCQQQNSGAEDFTLVVELFVDTGFGDAKLTWRVHPAHVGDVAPIISACEVAPSQATGPFTAVTYVPRAALFDAGAHTFTVDVPYEEANSTSYGGTIRANAHYTITIERL